MSSTSKISDKQKSSSLSKSNGAPYGNYIGGQWQPASGGATFTSLNPANNEEIIGHFAASTEADVNKAVEAAAKAFPAWKKTPAPHRADIILKAAYLLEERKEELATLMVREMGKVLKEARGDVQEAIDMGKYMAGEGRRLTGHTVPSELSNKFAMAVRAPIGCCRFDYSLEFSNGYS